MQRRTLWALTCGSLLASSCTTATPVSQPPNDSRPAATWQSSGQDARPTGRRQIQSVVQCPDGATYSVTASPPVQPLEPVTSLPTGNATHLDFVAWRQGQKVPSNDKIYFEDGHPFAVRFVAGSAFTVTDADATDGLAMVQVPAGSYDSYVSSRGKPNGTLTISDPAYFLAQTWTIEPGQSDWGHVGARQLPLPADYGLGDYRLTFNPSGLTSFTTRWFALDGSGSTGTSASPPPLPPLPPSLADLSGPDEVAPGETAPVQATVNDRNGDPLTYAWSTQMPDGQTVTGNPTGGATATWTAPRPAGTYYVYLTVSDPYYAVTACSPLPIRVPNVCPVPSLGTTTGAPLPTEAQPGETVSLTASGTDANGDTLSWRWTSSGGALSTTAGTVTTWTAPATAGTYTLTAYASDGQGCEVPAEVTITVPNACPTASIGKTGGGTLPTEVQGGQAVGLTATGTDANGDALTWRWTASGGTMTPMTGASTTWTAPATAGTYTVTAYVSDGHGCEVPAAVTFTVKAPDLPPGTTIGSYVVKQPASLTLDLAGNVWTTSWSARELVKFSPAGDRLLSKTFTDYAPGPVVVDQNGNLWAPDATIGHKQVRKFAPDGRTLGTYPLPREGSDIAIDKDNNVWVTNLLFGYTDQHYVMKLSNDGKPLGMFYANREPAGISADPFGNVWIANPSMGQVTKMSSTGALLGTYSFPGAFINRPKCDSEGNVWLAGTASPHVWKISQAGQILRDINLVGYYSTGRPTIDAAGNLWMPVSTGAPAHLGYTLRVPPTGHIDLYTWRGSNMFAHSSGLWMTFFDSIVQRAL